MHGAQDRLLPAVNATRLAELIPGADLRLIQGAGHFYPMNVPDEAAGIALSWMAAQDGVQPGYRSLVSRRRTWLETSRRHPGAGLSSTHAVAACLQGTHTLTVGRSRATRLAPLAVVENGSR